MNLEAVSLRDYVDQRYADLDKRIDQRIGDLDRRVDQRFTDSDTAVKAALASAEKAVNAANVSSDRAVEKAEGAAQIRFSEQNEFRGQLKDQAAGLMPRSEAESSFTAIRSQLAALSSRMDRNEGRGSGMHQGWLYLLGIISLVGMLLGIYGAFK